MTLSTSHDFYDFQFVTGIQLAFGKFGGRDGLGVVLDDDAAWQEFLREQKLLEGTGQLCCD